MRSNDFDTVYEFPGGAKILRETKYLRTREGGARIPDDGLIDETAIERFVGGDASVRLSPREVVCAVARLAAANESDSTIAARFGRFDKAGRKWVLTIRTRNRIPAAAPTFSEVELWTLLTEPAARAKASRAKLVAAGVVA